jgi:Na+-translocating ferredoxin:NAD+ oxidoreductase RnfG subunit
MRSLVKILFTILLIINFNSILSAQEIKEEVERIIKENFSEDVNSELLKFQIPKELKKEIEYSVKQRFFKDMLYIYKIYVKDTIIAYGFLDNVIGKSMPITFFVLLDIEGNIISTNIIKYREPYGGAVSNENWNKQFAGKNSKSDFTVGISVNSISGATISVNSVTKGIRKITLLYAAIKDKL